MPGIKRPFVNLLDNSSRSVEKTSLEKQKMEEKIQLNNVKKVRICYNDPDATDSDSDVDRDHRIVGCKRIVHEIIRVCDSAYKKSERKPFNKHQVNGSFVEGEGYLERPFQKMKSLNEIFVKSDVKTSNSSSYVGVRKRKSGKFAAEIRDPFTRKKVWLGTHDTEVNAAIAYQAKRLDFENSYFALDETNDRCSHPSPSSVLDMSKTTIEQANSVAMLDVDLPVLESVPNNAVEELQPSSSSGNQPVSVFSCLESIQVTCDDSMEFGTDDPYSLPSIIEEVYLEENLQREGNNDLKVLGFEDLEPGIFPEEMFYDPEKRLHNLQEINKEMLTWVDSLVLLEA